MLTRIEIDGFKTFEDFRMEIDPFQVILGPNASGKSNLFDAIHLLSWLASGDVGNAVSKLRGEPHELFRRKSDGSPGKRISLAAGSYSTGTGRTPGARRALLLVWGEAV